MFFDIPCLAYYKIRASDIQCMFFDCALVASGFPAGSRGLGGWEGGGGGSSEINYLLYLLLAYNIDLHVLPDNIIMTTNLES